MDPWANALQLGLLAIWWFHPLLWALQSALPYVREDCCDDLLLARQVTSSDGYCDVLMRAARELALAAPSAVAMSFGENLHPLGRRHDRIMDERLVRSARLSFGGIVVLGLVGGLLLPGLRSQQGPPAPNVAKLEEARKTAAATVRVYEQQDAAAARSPPNTTRHAPGWPGRTGHKQFRVLFLDASGGWRPLRDMRVRSHSNGADNPVFWY